MSIMETTLGYQIRLWRKQLDETETEIREIENKLRECQKQKAEEETELRKLESLAEKERLKNPKLARTLEIFEERMEKLGFGPDDELQDILWDNGSEAWPGHKIERERILLVIKKTRVYSHMNREVDTELSRLFAGWPVKGTTPERLELWIKNCLKRRRNKE